MVITKDFLDSNRTRKGGWTAAQLLVLGVRWPPHKGWAVDVVGRHVTQEQAEKFEQLKYVAAKIKRFKK